MDGLLKKPELARKLGVSLGKVNDLLRRKEIKPVKFGRCIRIPKTALCHAQSGVK